MGQVQGTAVVHAGSLEWRTGTFHLNAAIMNGFTYTGAFPVMTSLNNGQEKDPLAYKELAHSFPLCKDGGIQ